MGAWATVTQLAELSDVALGKRLRQCRLWLSQLLGQALGQVRLSRPAAGLRLRLVDASVITEPGSTGTDWRVHIGFDVGASRLDEWEVTDKHGGETLVRHAVQHGEILLGDRAYSHRAGLGYVLDLGAQLVTRINGCSLPMQTASGTDLDVRTWLARLAPRTQTLERAVQIETPRGVFALRLIARRRLAGRPKPVARMAQHSAS